MGKKSLIKSTSKKEGEKAAQKAAATTAKKAPAKTAKKAVAKTAKAKKSSGQTASKAKAKADPKGKTVKASAKTKPASKKRSIKELTFLKFEALSPAAKKLSAPKPPSVSPTAPPLIVTKDAKEAGRLRTLLVKKFNMAEIKASAKAPAAKQPVVDTPSPEVQKPRTEPTVKAAKVKAAKDDAPKAPEPTPVPKPVEQSVYITVEPKEPEAQSDPVSRSVKIAAAAAGLLIFILLAVSANNSAKYYIKPIDNAIEIWKGDFSPKDTSFFMVLHGAQVPEPLKDVYSKKEVFPLIFNYYIDKSDTLLEVKDLPDFEGIKKYLHKAEDFAVTNEMKLTVKDRLNTIARMILLYKAEVAISRNTVDSLESAIKILKDAEKLTSSTMQAQEISQKIDTARERIEALNAEAAVQPSGN